MEFCGDNTLMTAAPRHHTSASLEQKIGQLLLVGFPGDMAGEEKFLRLLARRPIGNIILFSRNCRKASELGQLISRLQQAIRAQTALPAFIAVDQEGGSVVRIQDGASPLPGAMATGAAFLSQAITIEDVEQLGFNCGTELRALGVNFNLAPVADLNTNPMNPVIGARSYGADPLLVSRLASAFANGLERSGVAACGKHFPGHGDTAVDSHLGLPVVNTDRQRLETVELLPFKALIKNGISAIMSAHVVFPLVETRGLPATLSETMLTDILRRDLGHQGLIVTDCLEMKAVHERYDRLAVRCLLAGADLLCISHSADLQEQAFDEILTAVQKGEISEERINQSYERICRVKKRLEESGKTASAQNSTTSSDRIELARKIASHSVSLLSGRQGGWLAGGGTYIDIAPELLTGVEDQTGRHPSLGQAIAAANPAVRSVRLELGCGPETLEPCLSGDPALPIVIGVYAAARHQNQLTLVQSLAEACRRRKQPLYCLSMRNPADAVLAEIAAGELAGTACAYEYTRLSVEAAASFLTDVNAPLGQCPVPFA